MALIAAGLFIAPHCGEEETEVDDDETTSAPAEGQDDPPTQGDLSEIPPEQIDRLRRTFKASTAAAEEPKSYPDVPCLGEFECGVDYNTSARDFIDCMRECRLLLSPAETRELNEYQLAQLEIFIFDSHAWSRGMEDGEQYITEQEIMADEIEEWLADRGTEGMELNFQSEFIFAGQDLVDIPRYYCTVPFLGGEIITIKFDVKYSEGVTVYDAAIVNDHGEYASFEGDSPAELLDEMLRPSQYSQIPLDSHL